MADATKYKSISLPIAAYNKLKKHCRYIADFDGVPLSISQTIQHHILLADDYLNERELPKDCYHLRTKPFVSNQTKLEKQVDFKGRPLHSSSPLESKVEDFLNGKDKQHANSN